MVPTVERGLRLADRCVNSVEGQRALTRAGQPGDHHQLVPGDLDVNVLEVVHPRPPDEYLLCVVGRHKPCKLAYKGHREKRNWGDKGGMANSDCRLKI